MGLPVPVVASSLNLLPILSKPYLFITPPYPFFPFLSFISSSFSLFQLPKIRELFFFSYLIWMMLGEYAAANGQKFEEGEAKAWDNRANVSGACLSFF